MHHLKIGFIAAIVVFTFGCSNTRHHEDTAWYDVKINPPVHLLELDGIETGTLDFEITDRKIYEFSFLIEDTMRKRVAHGRKWEEGFAGLQVIFAAFAAAASSSTGVHPDLVTGLSGLSALTPDIANIFNAGEKARAYAQGLELVEDANAEYIRARAAMVSDQDGLIPEGKVTAEGAALFVSVMSTLEVVRDAILQTIPNEEDLAKAKGKYGIFALSVSKLDIDTASAHSGLLKTAVARMPRVLEPQGEAYYTKSVSVVRGMGLVSCSSDSPNIVAATDCTGKSFTVVPKQQGKASITVVSETGHRAVVVVEVK